MDLQDLLLPPHEWVRWDGEVRAEEALERRKAPPAELVDALGRREVLESVVAEVGELDAALDECGGRRRDDDLAAVRSPCNACRTMNVVSHVSLVRKQRCARVDAGPHAHTSGRERVVEALRRRDSCRRSRERKEEGIALRVDLNPAFGDAGLTDDVSMFGERVRVRLLAKLVEQPGRPLDVGKDEGDGSDREIGAHTRMIYRSRRPGKTDGIRAFGRNVQAVADGGHLARSRATRRGRTGCRRNRRLRPA